MSVIHIEIRDRDHDLNAEARKLIAEGNAVRSDRIVFTRAGKPAISGGAGWWVDHRVSTDHSGIPVFKRFQGTAGGSHTAKSDLSGTYLPENGGGPSAWLSAKQIGGGHF
jgi:hypothetical protein